MSKYLDYLYNVYSVALLAGIICLDVLHFPVWNKNWALPFSHSLEQYYIKTYNDPLSAGLSTPNGWQSAMYLFEQLYIPFLFYQLFGKGIFLYHDANVDRIKKEIGGIVVGTELTVACSLCLFEIWAFDDSIVSRDQKMVLNSMYVPFLIPGIIWAVDSVYRVYNRIVTAEAQLKALKKQ